MNEDDDLSEIYVSIFEISEILISKNQGNRPHSVVLRNNHEYRISDEELSKIKKLVDE
jgi:hypothetical protein